MKIDTKAFFGSFEILNVDLFFSQNNTDSPFCRGATQNISSTAAYDPPQNTSRSRSKDFGIFGFSFVDSLFSLSLFIDKVRPTKN
jgi:hypothetical protein